MFSEDEQKEIEIEFLRSWEQAERGYERMKTITSPKMMDHMLTLISLLRARGYDRHFRAGQQLLGFIVSRSREHGLREDQPRLIFGVSARGQLFVAFQAPGTQVMHTFERVEITSEIEDLLRPLLAYPID